MAGGPVGSTRIGSTRYSATSPAATDRVPTRSNATILIQRENPTLPVSDECSDTQSEPRSEQGGSESRTLRATNKKLKSGGAGTASSYSGKVGVVWRSPVIARLRLAGSQKSQISGHIKNASLPESDFAVRRSQVDGTARTGQADTQAHHSRQGPTACVQTGVPARGILPPLVSARPQARGNRAVVGRRPTA